MVTPIQNIKPIPRRNSNESFANASGSIQDLNSFLADGIIALNGNKPASATASSWQNQTQGIIDIMASRGWAWRPLESKYVLLSGTTNTSTDVSNGATSVGGNTGDMNNIPPQPASSNTGLYLGIGFGVVILGIVIYLATKKKSTNSK